MIKKVIKKLFLVIFLFMLVYYPPIIQFNILHIIGIISWIYIMLNNKKIAKNISIPKVVNIYIIIVTFIIYLAIVAIYNEQPVGDAIKSFLFWGFDVVPGCIVVSYIFIKSKFDNLNLINLLLLVSLVQAMLTIMTYLIPEFQTIFINQMINYGFNEERLLYLSSFRWYGIATNLGFTTSIVQAFFSVIALYLSINLNWKYFLIVPILLFSAVVNSRNSILVFTIGLVLIILDMFFSKKKLKTFIRFLVLITLMIVIFIILMTALKVFSLRTYEWLIEGIKGLFLLLLGGSNNSSTNYFSYFTEKTQYTLPNKLINIILGTGEYANGNNNQNFATDIGYVNDIWLGGVLYAVAMYIISFHIVKKIYNNSINNTKLIKFISLFSLLLLFIQNIKGYIFSINDFTTIVFLFYIYLYVFKNVNIEKEVIS